MDQQRPRSERENVETDAERLSREMGIPLSKVLESDDFDEDGNLDVEWYPWPFDDDGEDDQRDAR